MTEIKEKAKAKKWVLKISNYCLSYYHKQGQSWKTLKAELYLQHLYYECE